MEVAQIGEAAWEVGKGGSCANIQEILAQILIDIDNEQVRELDLRVTLNCNFSFIYIYIILHCTCLRIVAFLILMSNCVFL